MSNSNYKVSSCFYRKNGGIYEKNNDTNCNITYPAPDTNNPYHIVATTDGGFNDSICMPCLSFEFSGNEYVNNISTGGIKIGEGFNCVFKADTPFLESNGYDGCIAFAWTNKALGSNALPLTPNGGNFNKALQSNSTENNYGLLASLLKDERDNDTITDNEIKGFSVTLYPGTAFEYDDGVIAYTTRLSRYILSYKLSDGSINYIAGDLPVSTNIYDDDGAYPVDTVLSVDHILGEYKFYLNGIMFVSVNDDLIDMDNWADNEGYFTASVIASPYIEANLEIKDINNNGTISVIDKHIQNNDIHLTEKEKNNLNNLGVSVLNYYDEERDEGDYTKAFQDALGDETVRRVYVPGGTYKITGELEVRDNCEFELAQDVVLDFDPIYTWEETDEESGEKTTVTIEPADFRCITLNMLSSLVGNHATIRVPYAFAGKVIYASTRSHSDSDSINSVLPFDRWDPQWKPARYLKDINIVKPIEIGHEITYRKSQSEIDELKKKDDYNSDVDDYITANVDGIHAAVNNVCKGIAVFIEGYRSGEGGSTFIWGLDYSGLRIAGAFEYGIKCTNNYIWVDSNGTYIQNPENTTNLKKKWAWIHDMRLSAFIDGCKTGVFMNHCNNAYISAIIQPRPAYIEKGQDDFSPYALNGIYLEDSTNVNLSGSRVWDWDDSNTKWKFGNDYQHLRLKGDCKGLILDDFKYYANESYNLRDLIKVDDLEDLDNITILQEPVSKFFSFDTENENGNTVTGDTHLKDGIYIKANYIEGLDERIRAILDEEQ